MNALFIIGIVMGLTGALLLGYVWIPVLLKAYRAIRYNRLMGKIAKMQRGY